MPQAIKRTRTGRNISPWAIFPCPTCIEDGIPWARVYPTDTAGEKYYCPTCKNKYVLEEVQ